MHSSLFEFAQLEGLTKHLVHFREGVRLELLESWTREKIPFLFIPLLPLLASAVFDLVP